MPKKRKKKAPTRKANKKKTKKRGESHKELWIILAVIVVAAIALILIFSTGPVEEDEDQVDAEVQVEDVVDIQNCPEEFYKTQINVYPRDLGPDAFPSRLNIYEKDFLDNRGDYVGICKIGAGGNPIHTFCTNQTRYPDYIRNQEVVDGKIVRNQERWFVDITFDYTTCEKYGQIPTSKLDLYSCDIVSIKCWQ